MCIQPSAIALQSVKIMLVLFVLALASGEILFSSTDLVKDKKFGTYFKIPFLYFVS